METKRYRMAPVALIRANTFSSKNIHPDVYNKLRASIIKSGVLQGLVVRQVPEDKCWEVVKGCTVLKILKEEHVEKVLITDLGPITREEAMRVYLQMTSVHEINYVKIGEILRELQDKIPVNELAKIIPHSIDEINELVKLLEFNWEKYEPPVEVETQTSLFS